MNTLDAHAFANHVRQQWAPAGFQVSEITDAPYKELVAAKLEGGEAFTVEEKPTQLDETDDVSDLLAKLEASVKKRQGAAAEESAPAKKAPAKKAAKKAPAKKAAAKK